MAAATDAARALEEKGDRDGAHGNDRCCLTAPPGAEFREGWGSEVRPRRGRGAGPPVAGGARAGLAPLGPSRSELEMSSAAVGQRHPGAMGHPTSCWCGSPTFSRAPRPRPSSSGTHYHEVDS
jgi:hypothetical protein